MSSCDSTCVGLAVGLGILFFILGCLVLWYLKDYIMPKPDEDVEAKSKLEEQDIEAGYQRPTTNNEQIVDPAAFVDSKSMMAASNKRSYNEEPVDGNVVVVEGNSTLRRKLTSNNDRPIDAADLNKRSNNEKAVDGLDVSGGGIKRKTTSNNDRPVDVNDLNRAKRSNNERSVDGSHITRPSSRGPASSNNDRPVDVAQIRSSSRGPTSNNETPVDANAVDGPKSFRGRRTSSNNERVVETSEIEPKEPEPTPAEVEATRKRAASLERRLEEMSKIHTNLAETARKLQEEIAELSSKNNDMLLE